MRYAAILSLAAILATVLAAGAQAAPLAGALEDGLAPMTQAVEPGDFALHPLHPCHGAMSGTHDRSCGTLTGGPAGGLF